MSANNPKNPINEASREMRAAGYSMIVQNTARWSRFVAVRLFERGEYPVTEDANQPVIVTQDTCGTVEYFKRLSDEEVDNLLRSQPAPEGWDKVEGGTD